MADNYSRLICFVVDICPEPLRAFCIKLAKEDAGSSYTSLNAYLNQRKQDILQLRKKKIIRTYQLNLIFPSHGTGKESYLDVTLLVTLMTNLFQGQIQQTEKDAMNEIRNIRNTLQHMSNTANISSTEFNNHWVRLETAAMALAQQVFSVTEQASYKTKIDELKKNNPSNLAECLRLWHEETVKHMASKIEDMSNNIMDLQNKLADVKSNTDYAASTLHNVTVTKPGPSGDGSRVKRLKTVDPILSGLRASFDRTMKTEIGQDFSSSAKVTEICICLRHKHHVVVTGGDGNRYVQAALAAVKGMGYMTSRCVEMLTSSDWRHVDPEDVDLVLCRDPFGSSCYDEKKAKSMADIFNNMLCTTKEEKEADRIDIIFVTNISFLSEFKQRNYSEILEEVVTVFELTTEEQPADLTSGCMGTHIVTENNVKEMTELFLQKHVEGSKLVDADKLKLVKRELKVNKMVVITGPRKCGKTSLAVSLIESLKTYCRLLYNPDDVRYIDLNNPCLVIVDEFAGKYRYEEDDVFKWYKAFDFLYDATKAGKLNVIVTCETKKLDKCCNEIAEHELLKNRVDLSDNIFIIKEESLEDIVSLDVECDAKQSVFERSQLNEREVAVDDPKENTSSVWQKNVKASDNGDMRPTVKEPDGTVTLPYGLGHNRTFGDNTSVQGESNHPRPNLDLLQQSADKIQPVSDEPLPHLWSVASKHIYNISVGKEKDCHITGSCHLPSGESLLADCNNRRLKKLDTSYKVKSFFCGFEVNPWDVCYIGNNKAVVSMRTNLTFVDVVSMTITRSVNTEHACGRLACHGNLLYVADSVSVYEYNTDGIKQRILYSSDEFVGLPPNNIAVSNDGSEIYILHNKKLTAIDNSGKQLYTFEGPLNRSLKGLCVDGEGHVLVCESLSGNILQISSDGSYRCITASEGSFSTLTLHFDRQRSRLICGGFSNTLTVLHLL